MFRIRSEHVNSFAERQAAGFTERMAEHLREVLPAEVAGHSGGRPRRAERGTTPVRSEKRGPAQQVESQIGKQEAVDCDPADGLQHLSRTRRRKLEAGGGAANAASATKTAAACR